MSWLSRKVEKHFILLNNRKLLFFPTVRIQIQFIQQQNYWKLRDVFSFRITLMCTYLCEWIRVWVVYEMVRHMTTDSKRFSIHCYHQPHQSPHIQRTIDDHIVNHFTYTCNNKFPPKHCRIAAYWIDVCCCTHIRGWVWGIISGWRWALKDMAGCFCMCTLHDALTEW